jgi:hypothetical protein
MTNIILPDGVENNEEKNEQEVQPLETDYKATEEDEERFFLMYHMNFQPSEAEKIAPKYRKWLIMRFIAQKNLEQEAMERQRLMRQIGPNLQGK